MPVVESRGICACVWNVYFEIERQQLTGSLCKAGSSVGMLWL